MGEKNPNPLRSYPSPFPEEERETAKIGRERRIFPGQEGWLKK
jgi:hypothetical protein